MIRLRYDWLVVNETRATKCVRKGADTPDVTLHRRMETEVKQSPGFIPKMLMYELPRLFGTRQRVKNVWI